MTVLSWATTPVQVTSDMCAQQKLKSESSVDAFWIAKGAKFLHVDNKDSD